LISKKSSPLKPLEFGLSLCKIVRSSVILLLPLFIWTSGFREDFFISAYQKQELPVAAMFVNGSGQNEQSL
jgi:hypothetical protein